MGVRVGGGGRGRRGRRQQAVLVARHHALVQVGEGVEVDLGGQRRAVHVDALLLRARLRHLLRQLGARLGQRLRLGAVRLALRADRERRVVAGRAVVLQLAQQRAGQRARPVPRPALTCDAAAL